MIDKRGTGIPVNSKYPYMKKRSFWQTYQHNRCKHNLGLKTLQTILEKTKNQANIPKKHQCRDLDV